MRAITTTMIALVALMLPGVAAAQQDYPPAGEIQVECSFDGSQVSCDGSGFEPASDVTGTVKAPDGSVRRTDDLAANAQGNVLYRFTPVCDVDSLTVTLSGTSSTGSSGSDSDTVDISSCAAGGGGNLPRTGGGLALLGLLALAGAAFVRGRR